MHHTISISDLMFKLVRRAGNHCVDLSYKELKERYKNPHAWKLADVKPVEDVWYYDHPNGAVIWVKDVSPIDEMQDERIRYGY